MKSEVPTREEVIQRLEDFTRAVTGDTRDWGEFYLRIPADPHHDSDFILTEAAKLLASDADRISALERTQIPPEIVERVKAHLECHATGRHYSDDSSFLCRCDSMALFRDITAIGEQRMSVAGAKLLY